ncbi:MAG: glucuronate isomerase [Clostridia bacterium]|nr:glucuronate isomerase [Clostridia bacterium]
MNIICDDFLLKTKTAKHLYHDYAKDLPIIDYHCHLDPKQIAEDHRFADLGELLLGGDHYKWRAMRSFGIDEKFITGDASYKEKFEAFASMIPYAIGNPLYHWTHLELARYFGIEKSLTPKTCDKIFDKATALLQTPGYSAKGLIERSNVEVVCTTDDPLDSLEYHKILAKSGFSTKVLPTFRPDRVTNIRKEDFCSYIEKTGAHSLTELKTYLVGRLDHFAACGCRLADHGLTKVPFAIGDADKVFSDVLNGKTPTEEEAEIFETDLLLFFAKEYVKRDFCMQIHYGATRNNNQPAYRALGPDTGYDAIGSSSSIESLSKLLNAMEEANSLPKTILYSLNPGDTFLLGALMGCFQKGPQKSKLQLGSGWWFSDQKDGMEAQLRTLGNLGILGAFVGMLTDSRSFVSYPRHEYFRRIFCALIGDFVEDGLYPNDEEMLENIVKGVCYENAKRYFNF